VLSGQVGNDLLPVKAAVLYENLSGEQTTNYHSGYVKAWDVALQGLGIAGGAARDCIEMDAQFFQKRKIRVVAGHGENFCRGEDVSSLAIY
jgi:hypothetical protein